MARKRLQTSPPGLAPEKKRLKLAQPAGGEQVKHPTLRVVCDDAVNQLEIPEEILALIFARLNLNDLCWAGLVCKHWYRVHLTDSLWQALFCVLCPCPQEFGKLIVLIKTLTQFLIHPLLPSCS